MTSLCRVPSPNTHSPARPPEVASGERIEMLFIIDQLCALGGAERVLLRIAEHLPRHRFSPRIITFQANEALIGSLSSICPIRVFPMARTYDRRALSVAAAIRNIVRSQKIQITHTFHETSDLWAGMIARMSGCPILISSRRDMGILRGRKHRYAYRVLGGYFDEVQTVSEQVRDFCINEDGLDPDRVITVPNGIDLTDACDNTDTSSVRKHFGIGRTGPLIVAVGNIRRVKGFDVLARAAALIRERIPDATVAIAGEALDETCVRDLRALSAQLGIDESFKLLGGVNNIPALLRSADVFCLPSRSEGMSNALLEAMACELPCVATRVGGNSELVVDGETGYLVDPDNAKALAGRVIGLLEQTARARAFGRAARRLVADRFTTETMVAAVVRRYEHLLAARRG